MKYKTEYSFLIGFIPSKIMLKILLFFDIAITIIMNYTMIAIKFMIIETTNNHI